MKSISIEFEAYLFYTVVERDNEGKVVRTIVDLFRHEALDILREWSGK